MGTELHATARERRDWTCPSCGALIDAADRFRFLVEYQRYMEAPAGSLEGVGTARPKLACQNCLQLAEELPRRRPGGGWAIWVAVAFIPIMAGLFILGLIASWMAR